MDKQLFLKQYDFSGKTAIVTGGTGVICSTICRALATAGANVAVLGHHLAAAEQLASEICSSGGKAIGLECDVLERDSIDAASLKVQTKFGGVEILINGAGGNKPEATTNPNQSFFNLPVDALRGVLDLNLLGTMLPCQVFGKLMAERKSGVILNISSMASFHPLTRTAAYSAAKAGVSNFTQWLAVHMAQEYSLEIRVNAIAPGFFLTEQNRFLLTDKQTEKLTPRGQSILGHTPMGRFGTPNDLVGAVLWLLSPASAFVTGIVVPVDGGFSAYSGV
jgi:NAD(P)-dependent dehydrogenase (short-subunit alcohol dehydrogenase family)